jgi:uncharacterized OB-fold protein
MSDSDPIKVVPMHVRLEYTVTAGRHYSRYLLGLAGKRILGGRCPRCSKVYVPPRGSCPTCGVPTGEQHELAQRATVTTFCVVNIPFGAMPFPPPYVVASLLLDGADLPILHLVRGVEVSEVRMGLRVRPVWVPDAELAPSVESIRWFEPSGEPDADFASYEAHL